MQEILRQSAESKMSIDPISQNAILKLFSNKLFLLARTKQGKLFPADKSIHMPEYLTYATAGTSAGKRKQPKDIAKMKLDDHQRLVFSWWFWQPDYKAQRQDFQLKILTCHWTGILQARISERN
jgi:hypothetical protein